MKLIDICRGCGSRKLVNYLKLCKRCNKHASDFLSMKDIEAARLEREAALEAKAKMKEEEERIKAEKEKEKAEEEKAEEEEEPEEGKPEKGKPEKEEGAEAPKKKEGEKGKSKT